MSESARVPSPAQRERVRERADINPDACNSPLPIPLPPSAGEGVSGGPHREDGSLINRTSTKRARDLRQSQTDAEAVIWNIVKARRLLGFKFKRQAPIGLYFADFLCHEAKLIIEIDGGQHCENKKDEIRTKFLEGQGYQVIRFWNNEVMGNTEGVVQALSLTLSQHTLGEGTKEKSPSPGEGRERVGERADTILSIQGSIP